MDIRERMLRAIGLDEMAIKKTTYDQSTGSYGEKDVTARTLAKDIVLHALQTTGYWHSDDIYKKSKMTPKEVAEVDRQVKKFTDRFIGMLKRET